MGSLAGVADIGFLWLLIAVTAKFSGNSGFPCGSGRPRIAVYYPATRLFSSHIGPMLKPFKTQPGTRRTRGLAAYLALAFSLLSVLFTLILVALVERDGVEEVKTSIGHGLAELAMQTTDKLDRGMFERYREVGLLAQRSELVVRQAGAAARRRLLDTMKESYGLLEGADISIFKNQLLMLALACMRLRCQVCLPLR
jgi:hypothetical protein